MSETNKKIFDYYWNWLECNSPINPNKLQQKPIEEISPIFVRYWQDYVHNYLAESSNPPPQVKTNDHTSPSILRACQ